MNTPNPHDPESHATGCSRTVPFQPDNNEIFSGATLSGRREFASPTIEGSARPLELAPGYRIPDGRLFTSCLSRENRFIIPRDTQALILDFDGTTAPLNLSEGIRQKAFRRVIVEVLSNYFAETDRDRSVTRADIVRCHNPAIGYPEREMSTKISESLRDHYQVNVQPEDIFSRWVDYTCQLVSQVKSNSTTSGRATIVPGLVPILHQALERNIPIAKCTNGAAEFVKVLGQAIGITPFLHPTANVYTNRHPNIKPKPAPDPYLLACDNLKVDPKKVVIAEDSATGALAGLRAGGLVLLQPSEKRFETFMKVHDTVQREHPQWFEERQGRVVLLARHRGFKQVAFA
jgi:beta-phosphoglucomutase-like phosphatase (HAD superfamily)